MPAPLLPPGRVSVRGFCRITGLSKSRFYRDFRWVKSWIGAWDMREDTLTGNLTLSEAAARDFARDRAGRLATDPAQRSANLKGSGRAKASPPPVGRKPKSAQKAPQPAAS